ncbi:hypothetical protein L218DRAFT_963505 [Marasmius fiardii PR-910]|nr:hypothetical protein L218DRAFT_963505 [Marasmius fiardii PR-910]
MLTTLRNQHYYPYQSTSKFHGSRGFSSPLTPRERYLASLAEAEAAEAEFIASEAERFQHEEEELLLRRRLEELQFEKRFPHHQDYSPRGSLFDDHLLRHRHSHHLDDFDRSTDHSSHDRLASLRRELEEEELRIARQRKQEQEREALRAKELREAERLALLRKAEENRLKVIRRHREQEEQKLLQIRLAQQQEVEHQRTVVPNRPVLRRPTVRFAVDSTSECLKRASCVSSNTRDKVRTAQEVLQLLFGPQQPVRSSTASAAQTTHKETPKDSDSMAQTEDFFKLLFGGNTHPERKSVTPSATGPKVSRAGKEQESSKPATSSEHNSKAPATSDSNLKGAEEFWKALFGQAGVPAPSQDRKHVATPQDFFDMLLQTPLVSEEKPTAGELSVATKTQAQDISSILSPILTQSLTSLQPTTSTTAPRRPVSPSTNLKEQLESRLNNDEAVEIRDTIQAILASLADAAAYNAASTSSGNSKPGTSSSTSSTSTSSPSDSKGKGKAETSSDSSTEPTSNDVLKSMEAVHSIETAFRALQQDFVFPTQLDFTPTPSAAPSPVSSDTESSTPSITKLAYTSRNHPVRYYEQSLSGLLSQLDGVESFGNVEVRTMRKEVVARVEGALDELEREVDGRWKARVSKQERDKSDSEEVAIDVAVPEPQEFVVLDKSGAVEAAEGTTTSANDAVDNSDSATPEVLVEEEKATLEDQQAAADVDQKEQDVSANEVIERDHHAEVSEQEGESLVESLDENRDSAIEDSMETTEKNLGTEIPSSLSYPPSYPSTSGDSSTTSSAAASVATIRPFDLDIETASTSSEDEDGQEEEEGKVFESDSDGFLLSATVPEEKQKDGRNVVQEEVGSDWSEVEA